jgi:hypothetical protein
VISLNSAIPDAINDFRGDPWPHQRTIVTPRTRMSSFLSTLLSISPIEQGVASTDQVVFEPDHVLELLAGRELRPEDCWSLCASASGARDVEALLAAMLSDWIDFVFVPSPATFAIYADHDEYLTLYMPSEAALNQLVASIEAHGFSFVPDYVRPSKGEIWR